MASCSCSSSLALPELRFLSPKAASRYHLSLSKQSLYRSFLYKNYPRCNLGRRIRVAAGKQDGSVVVEEKREPEFIKGLNDFEVNGNGSASRSDSVGSVNGGVNGYANGSLVKYVNGNGNGGVAVEVVGQVEEEEKLNKEIERKKKVEEIGKEDAWFKKSGQEKVEDQVPPFPSETAVSIVEEELGAPLDDVFERFDVEPIAAASLGQVHRARLKGEEVVVKVQRPGLKDLFDIDLKNLRVIAEYLQKIDPKSDGAKRDWVAIYDECASVLYQEIDYTQEAANAELFASNFKDMDYVKVPTIFWEYTTPQILTMEYVPGIKINRIQSLDELGVDRKRLGRYAVESYLEQILSHGFFHADPHPGNIAVDDVNGGRLIFYDFGMMGSISPNIREGLLEAFYGIYEKDADKVLQAMVQMGVLVPTGDTTAVRRTAQFFLNSFEERLAAQRKEREITTQELGFKKPLSKEEKIEKKKQRLAAIGEDLLAIAADQPFRFPATFTFVVRAFSVLDGIGKGLDPRFDITEIAKPYAMELLKFREAGVEDFRNRWDRQTRAFYNLFRQADRVEKLAETIQRLEQGDLKLRVRTLESERAFQRVAAVQKTVGSAVGAGSLVNLATILYLNSIRVPAILAYVSCAFFGFQVLFGIIKTRYDCNVGSSSPLEALVLKLEFRCRLKNPESHMNVFFFNKKLGQSLQLIHIPPFSKLRLE
ncbi:hypothetical protein CUMW_225980 [Citrus unshiu]|uniref:ABC1 atypical kinase-like domain-containing protein n=2 Tax=Citrus TaxID=2706 RepID=A0A2H5QGY8_CITUN|nr:hypothetical protein CUMW_225980 [Citrus unshiu]